MRDVLYFGLVMVLIGSSVVALLYSIGSNLDNDMLSEGYSNNYYESIVIYRNDDVDEAFSKEFNTTNNIFIDYSVPVTHSIIPDRLKKRDNTAEHCERFRELQRENPEIIDYSLHGYDHNLSGHPPTEFKGESKKVQNQKIEDGITFFENCIGQKPQSFVPPGNTYDNKTVKILDNKEINLLSADSHTSPQKWSFNIEPIDYSKSVYLGGMSYMFVSDWDNKTLISTEASLNGLNKSIENNYLYTQVLHYKALESYNSEDEDSGFQKLDKMINQSSSYENVKHYSLGDLSDKLEHELVQVSKNEGWIISRKH